MSTEDGAGVADIVAILMEMTAAVHVGLDIIQRFATATPAVADGACTHPDDARVDFSTMTESAWTCRVCGYQYHHARTTSPTS